MQIYIILTHSGSVLSKIIKCYTKCEFSHVSISLDKDLTQMYSFGRLHPYNPFYGGFVHEEIGKGTYQRFKNTVATVYELKIEDKQYENIQNRILIINKNKYLYKFNIIGLFAVALHIKIQKKMSFYCAEFVKYLLDNSQIETTLPEIIKPEDFKKLNNIKMIYKGKLNEYRCPQLTTSNNC